MRGELFAAEVRGDVVQFGGIHNLIEAAEASAVPVSVSALAVVARALGGIYLKLSLVPKFT